MSSPQTILLIIALLLGTHVTDVSVLVWIDEQVFIENFFCEGGGGRGRPVDLHMYPTMIKL